MRDTSKIPFFKSSAGILLILFVILVASCVFFMTWNAPKDSWDFIVPFRGKKLLLLISVAYAVGISTLLFQTLTNNPILTPSILGFDSLYLLMQTLLVLLLGVIGFTQMGALPKFLMESAIMIVASLILFSTLTRQSYGDIARMVLIGVIFGIFFKSLNNLFQRFIDPTSFVIVQTQSFASFTTVNKTLLVYSIVISFVSFLWIWWKRHELDIIMLGREKAIALGVNYRRNTFYILVLISILVSVSTAMVGPISFFGLLVCAIVNGIFPRAHHYVRIPAVFLLASITLVLGQAVFEHVMELASTLSVVIEFLGGMVFLWLIFNQRKKKDSAF